MRRRLLAAAFLWIGYVAPLNAQELIPNNFGPHAEGYYRSACPEELIVPLYYTHVKCAPVEFAHIGNAIHPARLLYYATYRFCDPEHLETTSGCNKTLLLLIEHPMSTRSKELLGGKEKSLFLMPLYEVNYQEGRGVGIMDTPRLFNEKHPLLLIQYEWAGTARAKDYSVLDLTSKEIRPVDIQANHIKIPED